MPSGCNRSRLNLEPMTAAALKRALGCRVKAVDAGGNGRLHSGGHADLGSADRRNVAAALPVQHTALGQFAHDLLGEERITGGPLGDRLAQPADGGVRPEQLRNQCHRLRITKRRKGYRLRTVHPSQRSLDIRVGR